MRGDEVAAILKRSGQLARQIQDEEQEKPQERPRRRPRWQSAKGDPDTEMMADLKQLLIPRNQQSLDRGHDDEAARERKRGNAPLLPNELPAPDSAAREFYSKALRPRDQIKKNIPLGHMRALDYDKPYLPSAEFVLDSISPSEMNRVGPAEGAPDFRYNNATFPNDEYMGYYGTEGRYMAELERQAYGAPRLHPLVDPLTSGSEMPTRLEQALMALKAAGLRR